MISGTPAESGTYTLTVGLWAGNLIITKSFALVIVPGIAITTDYLKPGIRGEEYRVTLSNDSGAAASSCVWYVADGNLPAGLGLSRNTGEISGTPTTAGTYDCDVTVATNWGTAAKIIRITVA